MDAIQIEIIQALNMAKMPTGTFSKKFTKDLFSISQTNPSYTLSEKQIEWMYRILYKFRKQCKAVYQQHQTHPLCAKKTNQLNIFS